MKRFSKTDFTVHVFRPNGWLFTKILVRCCRAETAINQAKKAIYRKGLLAHFYSYVPTSN